MRCSICNVCPHNGEDNYESGHKATFLSRVAWPFVQISFLLYIISFSSPNWCDGPPPEHDGKDRLYAGPWRTCIAGNMNTSHHPALLPVDLCSDTAVFIVDGMKTGWVGAWRVFTTLSLIFLFLTSVLITVYMFGSRLLRHSTFPLFWSFVTGFTSVMFGTLGLLVFYVKSGKSAELRGVPYGWAAGVNVASVACLAYTCFIIIGEFIEITDFRKARKIARRARHMTLSDEQTMPQGGSTSTGDAVVRNLNEARTRGSIHGNGSSRDAVEAPGHTGRAPVTTLSSAPMTSLTPVPVTSSVPVPVTSSVPVTEQKPSPMVTSASPSQAGSGSYLKPKEPAEAESNGSEKVSPSGEDAVKDDTLKQDQDATGSLGETEDQQDRFRYRKVKLRRQRLESQTQPQE